MITSASITRICRRGCLELFLILTVIATFHAPSFAGDKKLNVAVGSSIIVGGQGVDKVAVSNPAVLNVQPVSIREILLTGASVGSTQVFLWDRLGRHEYNVVVTAGKSAQAFVQSVTDALDNPSVTVEAAGDKLLLMGEVASAEERTRCEKLAGTYYPNVENLLTVKPGCPADVLDAIKKVLEPWKVEATPSADGKVIISGCVCDSSTVAAIHNVLEPWSKQADFVFALKTTLSPQQENLQSLITTFSAWNINGTLLPDGRILLEGTVPDKDALAEYESVLQKWPKEVEIVSRVTILDSSQIKQVLIRARVVEITRENLKDIGVDWSRIVLNEDGTYSAEDQPFIIGQSTSPNPIFGGPPLRQLDRIGARVWALVKKNKAQLLSQPSLITTSGHPANILIGGEIPVPVPQSGTGGGAVVTIQYKPFGISLDVLPTVGPDDEITMLVRPEVSALDYTNAVELSGTIVPAFRTRRAESTVHVASGESIAIGGLYSKNDVKNTKGLPLLQDIPVLGNFFKKTSTQKSDSELLIIVTPEIVQPPACDDAIKDVGPTPESLPLSKTPLE
ncbi:pilus assembly protein N-terminal domain-containing protein [bacterium]|nr:pilus assembly protein N-terminal domain-containing protein [bacterium]